MWSLRARHCPCPSNFRHTAGQHVDLRLPMEGGSRLSGAAVVQQPYVAAQTGNTEEELEYGNQN